MAAVCAAAAVAVLIETVLRWPDGHLRSYLLIPLLALASLATLPIVPQSGAWLIVTLYCVGLVSPFPMSYSYTLALLVALAVIAKDSRAAACIAGVLSATALMVDRRLLFGWGLSDSVVVSFAYCMFAIVIGMASRWRADRARMADRLHRQRERESIALTLHDVISNDLAYAIMRIDDTLRPDARAADAADGIAGGGRPAGPDGCGMTSHGGDHAGTLRELRSVLDHALHGTHAVIATLDGRMPDPEDSAEPERHHRAGDRTERIVSCIDEQEERLRRLGFCGQTLLPDTLPHLSETRTLLLTGLLEEIYMNIAKHGDPGHGYVVALARENPARTGFRERGGRQDGTDGSDIIVVTAADTPRRTPASTGLGSGLERYRRMGVGIDVTADADQWTLSARLPAR
ncbi:hypothetical protein [Bifidobacterium samirii]|uniref:Signal transduction histidine kinase-like protein n=1 Tax=Bifidobacterium samirii TaxID=2306974 RepID=A0A430FNT9_9BIFI|nr:hypothetical protein [Bifidobacterium samirii]RSX54491.1 Signal transduction histidine kinase-like protein [Bifidobacterium samirii]